MPLQIPSTPVPELAIQHEPRFLTPDDAAAIAAFDAEMFPQPHLDDPAGYWAEQTQNHPRNTEIIVAGGQIAAYMHVVIEDSEVQPGRKWANLQALGVAQEHRHQGVGSFMATRAMQRALGEHNVIAFRFFAESGSGVAEAATEMGFEVSSGIIWGRDLDGHVRAGQYFDLHVPQD